MAKISVESAILRNSLLHLFESEKLEKENKKELRKINTSSTLN